MGVRACPADKGAQDVVAVHCCNAELAVDQLASATKKAAHRAALLGKCDRLPPESEDGWYAKQPEDCAATATATVIA